MSMQAHTRSVLRQARFEFDRLGRIPLNVASQLMGLGINVGDLEAHWSGNR